MSQGRREPITIDMIENFVIGRIMFVLVLTFVTVRDYFCFSPSWLWTLSQEQRGPFWHSNMRHEWYCLQELLLSYTKELHRQDFEEETCLSFKGSQNLRVRFLVEHLCDLSKNKNGLEWSRFCFVPPFLCYFSVEDSVGLFSSSTKSVANSYFGFFIQVANENVQHILRQTI